LETLSNEPVSSAVKMAVCSPEMRTGRTKTRFHRTMRGSDSPTIYGRALKTDD
jgi:hypothetical protein